MGVAKQQKPPEAAIKQQRDNVSLY